MIKQTYLIICILLVGWLTGCQDYDETINNPSVVDGNKIEVSIATTMPALTVQTKAEADSNEKQLTHVDVLVFEVDGSDEIYSYRTQHSDDLGSPGTSGQVEIKVKLNLSKNDEKYRIVFIANMKKEVEDFFLGKEEQELTTYKKDELLKQITLTQQEAWPTGENFRALPMWGEASQTTKIDKNTVSGDFGSMKLLRSVARIELGVSITGSQQTDGSDFIEIRKVKVYNAREKGRAVPDPAHITDGKATAPTLLSGSGIIDKEDMTYELSTTGENKNLLTGVYVNEAANRGEDGEELSDALFLIVEAVYKKEDPTNDKATFYKIGFYGEDNKPTDILRNFTYNMTITSVSGPGEEEEEDAVGGTSRNLTVAMTDWSDGKMKHVVFNGQYYLAVSESNISVSKEAGTQSLWVKTNYPKGWEAKIKEGSSWLKNLNPVSSSALEQEEKLSFSVEEFVIEENGGNNSREGTITLSCANQLELELKIQQVAEEGVSLRIQIKNANGEYVDLEDNTLLFHSGNHYEIEPRELRINWTPATENLIIDFDRSFEWDNDLPQLQTIYEGGEVELKIAPARMLTRATDNSDPLKAWFPSEETDIKVQVGGDSSTKQILSVKKQHYEVYIERSARYKLDGKKHSIKLYSNSPYWVARFTNTDGIRDYIDIDNIEGQSNPPEGGNNVKDGTFRIENDEVIIENAGESIEFILKTPPTGSSINAEVTIEVKYDDFGKTITKEYLFQAYYEDDGSEYIAGGNANCYMLKPSTVAGSKKIQIPVSQANRASFWLGEQIKTGDALTPCFIWTDHPGGYGGAEGNSNTEYTISSMRIIGTGPTAILEVTPGNAEGNAVVGIKKGNEILWSWHLWVSDFDPNMVEDDRYVFRNYQFLDRNLGALSDDPANPKSFGLYYQWGRKDPFPSAKTAKLLEFVPIYNELGDEIQMTSSQRPESTWDSKTHFLKEATRNPLNFIKSTGWWCTGALGTYGEESTKFWSENETTELATATKGVFDPCPDGWKTVPASTTSNNKEWYVLFNYCSYHSNGHYSELTGLGQWPHAGQISCNSATLTDMELGKYWTGNRSGGWDTNAIHFLFNSSDGHPSEANQSSNGASVRCMRRTDEMRSGGGN